MLGQNEHARTKFTRTKSDNDTDKMKQKPYKYQKIYIPHVTANIEDEKMKTKIEWTEVFGLTRNKISKIKPDLILRIPGHIFLNLDEIDNNDVEE